MCCALRGSRSMRRPAHISSRDSDMTSARCGCTPIPERPSRLARSMRWRTPWGRIWYLPTANILLRLSRACDCLRTSLRTVRKIPEEFKFTLCCGLGGPMIRPSSQPIARPMLRWAGTEWRFPQAKVEYFDDNSRVPHLTSGIFSDRLFRWRGGRPPSPELALPRPAPTKTSEK